MSSSARFATVTFLVLAFASFAFAQTDAGAAAALASSQPGYADKAPVTINPSQQSVLQAVTSATILDFPANADSSRAIFAAGNGSSPNGSSGTSASNAAPKPASHCIAD